MSFELRPQQKVALSRLRNGSILNGSVGSGKSLTSLAYYLTKVCGGSLETFEITNPVDLYIITTAKKRDEKEWLLECSTFGWAEGKNECGISITVDSWNNIGKYKHVYGAFFIFDEQRVVGTGKWARTFIYLAKRNQWILLSATPGDNFMDYWAVFVANGWYANQSDFMRQHCVFKPYVKY